MKSEYFLTESLLEPHAWLRNRVLLVENERKRHPSKSWILSVPHKDYDLGCKEKILMMKHPGYKHIIDLFYLDLDVPYLISERCDYSLQNAKLEPKYKRTLDGKTKVNFDDKWKSMLQQVFEGIIYINEVGMIYHRDLTPTNVYWHGNRWVIADFGLAIHFQRQDLQTKEDLQTREELKMRVLQNYETSLKLLSTQIMQAAKGETKTLREEYSSWVTRRDEYIRQLECIHAMEADLQRQYFYMDVIRFMYYLAQASGLYAYLYPWNIVDADEWLIIWHHLLLNIPDPKEWKIPVLQKDGSVHMEQSKMLLQQEKMMHGYELLVRILGQERLGVLKTCTDVINDFRNVRGINCEKQLRILPDPLY